MKAEHENIAKLRKGVQNLNQLVNNFRKDQMPPTTEESGASTDKETSAPVPVFEESLEF